MRVKIEWIFDGSTANDSFLLNGIDIFKKKWKNSGEKTTVIDPLYKVTKQFKVWSVFNDNEEITFAAVEFSNI